MKTPRSYDESVDRDRFIFSVDFFLTEEDVEEILSIKNEVTDEDIARLKRLVERLFSRIDKRFHEGEQWYQILSQCWRLQDDLGTPLLRLAESAE